ncbi:hypothetical protein PENTCL1PPCAC_13146, partial [Pristionchus entomophagus]
LGGRQGKTKDRVSCEWPVEQFIIFHLDPGIDPPHLGRTVRIAVHRRQKSTVLARGTNNIDTPLISVEMMNGGALYLSILDILVDAHRNLDGAIPAAETVRPRREHLRRHYT